MLPQDNEQAAVGLRCDFTDGMAYKLEVLNFEDKTNSDYNTVLMRTGIRVIF